MSKKLNIAMINENVKKFDEKKKITLSDGNYTYIYPNFAPSKIREVIKETLMDFEKAKNVGIDLSGINIPNWLFMNMIRHFADLNIPNDVKKKSQIFVKLVDSDYFTDIIQNFPPDSLDKVTELLEATTKNLELMNKNKANETTIDKIVDKAIDSTEDEDKPLQ